MDNFAVTNGDLINSLEGCASALTMANNSLDESLGLITAGTEVTQDASRMGKSLRTVSLRIRGMNEETEELDDDLINIENDISRITGKQISLFTDDTLTTYRSTYEILGDIANIWDDISDANQAKLLEKLAGKTRANDLAAVLTNWEAVDEVIEETANSAGTAEDEFGKATEGLEFKINALKETAVGMYQDLLDSDQLKQAVDMLTQLLGLVQDLTGVIGKLGTFTIGSGILGGYLGSKGMGIENLLGFNMNDLFKSLGNAFNNLDTSSIRSTFSSLFNNIREEGSSAFNSVSSSMQSTDAQVKSMQNSFEYLITKYNDLSDKSQFSVGEGLISKENNELFQEYIDQLNGAPASLEGFNKWLEINDKQIQTNIQSTGKLSASFVTLGSKIASIALNAVAMMAVSMALQAIASAIDNVIHRQEKLEEAAEDAVTAYNEEVSELESLNDELETNQERIDELESKEALTYVEEDELENLRQANELLEQQIELQERSASEAGQNAATASLATLGQYTFDTSQFEDVEKRINSVFGESTLSSTDVEDQVQILQHYREAMAEAEEGSDEYFEALNKVQDAQGNLSTILLDVNQKLSDSRDAYDDVIDKVNQYGIASLNSTEVTIKEQYEYYENLYNEVLKISDPNSYYQMKFDEIFDTEGIEQTQADLIELEKAGELQDLDLSQYENLSNAIEESGLSAEEFKEQIVALTETEDVWDARIESNASAIDRLSTATSSFEDTLSSLNSAYEESISASGMTAESIEAVEEAFYGLESYNPETLFENTANGVRLNTQELTKLEAELEATTKSQYEDRLSSLTDQYEKLCIEISDCTDANERMKLVEQRNDLETQISSVRQLSSEYDGLTSSIQKWQDAVSGGEEGDTYDSIYNSLSNIKDLYDAGLTGTNEFTSFVDMMTNADTSGLSNSEIVEIYEKNIGTINRYFTEGSDGCQRFLEDIQAVNSEWASMDSEGNWTFEFDDEEIAEALGMSTELVEEMVRKLGDYGFDVHVGTDEAFNALSDLETEAKEAYKALGEKIDINIDSDSITELRENITLLEEQSDELNSQLKELENQRDSLNSKAALGDEDAIKQVDDLNEQIDDLNSEIENTNTLLDYEKARLGQLDSTDVKSLQEAFEDLQDAAIIDADIDIDFESGDIEDIEEAIDAVSEALGDLARDNDGYIDLEVEGAAEAVALFEALYTEKQRLEEPAVMSIDINELSGEVQNAISYIQDAYNAYEDYQQLLFNKENGIKVDDSELDSAKNKAEDLFSTISSMDSQTLAELGIEITGEESLDEAAAKIEALSGEQLSSVLNIEVDSSKVDEYSAEEKEGTVIYEVDDSKVKQYSPDNKSGSVTYSVDGTNSRVKINSWNVPTLHGKIIYSATGSVVNGSAGSKSSTSKTGFESKTNNTKGRYKGTALVNGSAYAEGNFYAFGDELRDEWRTQQNEVALTGELGQELVVNGNQWSLVGQDGAEFVDIPKGSVIFNAEQTEDLLTKGHTNSRGSALVNGTVDNKGTAYSGGSGGNSGTSSSSKKSSSSSSSKKSSSSSSKKSSSSSSKKSSSSSSSSADDFLETLDWIEIKLSRIERQVSNLDQKANNVYKSWSSRNTNLEKEIDKITAQINAENNAYDYYIKQANSVGLSSTYKNQVKNGTIKIEDIKDEDLYNKITEYQEW